MNKPIWITREGQKIPIEELETYHLVNILRYGIRKSEEWEAVWHDALAADAYEGGKAAADAARAAAKEGFDLLVTLPNPVRLPVWKHIVAECKKRGLWHELTEIGVK